MTHTRCDFLLQLQTLAKAGRHKTQQANMTTYEKRKKDRKKNKIVFGKKLKTLPGEPTSRRNGTLTTIHPVLIFRCRANNHRFSASLCKMVLPSNPTVDGRRESSDKDWRKPMMSPWFPTSSGCDSEQAPRWGCSMLLPELASELESGFAIKPTSQTPPPPGYRFHA
jgi:hypothetical protein